MSSKIVIEVADKPFVKIHYTIINDSQVYTQTIKIADIKSYDGYKIIMNDGKEYSISTLHIEELYNKLCR